MINKFKNLSSLKIIVFSIIFFVLLFLFNCTFRLSIESYHRYISKELNTITLSADDVVKNSIKEHEGQLLSSDDDPQFIINFMDIVGEEKVLVSDISINITYSTYPGEITLYYAQNEAFGFSNHNREWFSPIGQDVYTVQLSFLKNIYTLRIDPTMYAGNYMNLESIVLNSPKSILDYYNISASNIYQLLIFSLFLSAFLKLLQEALIEITVKK